jgi:predicted Zn-dependent peptidase
MDVLLAMLAEGNNPRLQTLLLENESLAFATGAEFLTSRQPSPFLIWAASRPEKAAEVKAKLDKEMTSIADGNITSAEVAAAKRRLEMSFWSSDETYTDQADVLGFYAAIDSYRFASEYIPLVRAVTVEDVKAVAKIYFAPSARVGLSLLPKKQGAEPSGGI